MKQVKKNKKFKNDVKRCEKRGYKLKKLHTTIGKLSRDEDLPISARPHKLKGEYAGLWECKIEPDWLLIYEIIDDKLYLYHTGTHSDLFRK